MAPAKISRFMIMTLRRKLIGLVLASMLLCVGCWLIYRQIEIGHSFGRRLGWLGPGLIIAGFLWIASDWFDL